MNKKENDKSKPTLLEKVALFDFNKYYTPTIRFLSHFLMWLIFTFFLQFSLLYDSGLPLNNTLAFSARSLICNMTIFYLFFYVFVPQTFLKNRVIPAILSLPLCILLWIILNHYCLVFIGKHFKIEGAYYKNAVESNLHINFWKVISLKIVMADVMPVLYSISPYFFTKIVFDIIRFYSKWFKSERKTVQLELEKLNLEKNFLKAQLNPHFLFNTLNNLYGLALRADSGTPEMIMQLSGMMRYSLYESNSNMVPLSKELEYLKNYVMLEKRRYKENKAIIFNVDDSHINGQEIAPLLTFTFVENSFKYGLKTKDEGFLKIDISIVNNVFHFSIVNDKKENIEEKKFGGIGIVNIRKRLALLYPDNHQLTVEDRGKSFYVEMKINLE